MKPNQYLLFILLSVLISLPAMSQTPHPYYDALILRKWATQKISDDVTKKERDTIATLLSHYLPKNMVDLNNSFNIIDSFKKNNPFFEGFFLHDTGSGRGTEKFGNLSLSSTLSSIGGLDVTNIADGLAEFLVKRTKQELTIAFFEKFESLIANPEYMDLRTVFPQTYQTLTIIGNEIYNYQGYIQTLRESFEKDFSTLTINLPTIVENHPTFFQFHKDLAAMLKSGCYIAGELRDKTHPGEILANYPDEYLDSLNLNWKGAIQTLQLISSSLRDTASNIDSIYWVSTQQIKKLISEDRGIGFKIYLGLLYQKALTLNKGNPITFNNGILLDTILNKVALNFSSTADFIVKFSEKANVLNGMIKQYKKTTNDSLAIQQYYNYFTASIDLLQQCSQIRTIPAFKAAISEKLDSTMKDYFNVARSASDMVLAISKRNYSAAIVNAVHIYDIVKVKQSNIDSKKINNTEIATNSVKPLRKKVIKSVRKAKNIADLQAVNIQNLVDTSLKDNQKIALKNADVQNELAASNNIKNSLFKYGSFMAAIVQAKSSDDIENTIEAFALPSGSSRIKRETPFNVSLNAYTGLYAGYEKISGFDQGGFKFNSFGVAAPIGIAASWGSRKFFWIGNERRKHWSYSLFVSLIDIGAVASFRFSNDSTIIKNDNVSDTLSVSQSSTIQLKNIFSPGLFISIGIPKCPLSVNFGAQVGPNLRGITSTNNSAQLDFNDNLYLRYSVSLCVDIPVLNFYTKPK